MEYIFSKVEPDLLLHIVMRFQDFNKPRTEIIDANNFLQAAGLRIDAGQKFRPHYHIWKGISYNETKSQESWVVLRGAVKCTFYDVDNTVIAEPILKERDACFTLHGGHTFESLEDFTCILEHKTGPYEGQEKDKIFIK
jgi:hypothetical protein